MKNIIMDDKIPTLPEESLESLTLLHQDVDRALDVKIVSFQNKNTHISLLKILFETHK